jgi:DNA-binding response OmpR family regulator
MIRKILVIEGRPISRKVVGIALAAEGHKIIEAGDGKTAIALMAKEELPLVLQDLLLADISGFDLVAPAKLSSKPAMSKLRAQSRSARMLDLFSGCLYPSTPHCPSIKNHPTR